MNTKRTTHTNHSISQFLLKWISLSVMAISMLSLPSVALAEKTDAGKVIFIFGQAWKHSVDGGKHSLTRGMKVHVGETIETASNGQVQIRMNDNGLVAIRPGSHFKIKAFKFSGANGAGSGEDKSYFQLLKGGFRSITGAVGQRNKKAYRVTTPVATIGIRGTDYTARLCSGDCQQADGLYMGVWQGGVSLSNVAGSTNIDAGQFAYVASEDASPTAVQSLPASLLASSSAAVDSGAAQDTDAASANQPLALLDSTPQGFLSPLVSLPKTGTATYNSYSFSGATSNGDAVGAGTTASLTADFTNQVVDANVVVITESTAIWSGEATDMSLNFDGSFSGDMTVADSTNSTPEFGSNVGGSMSGNLTGMGDGTVPTGATLDVNMESTFSTGTESLDASLTLQ